MVPQCDVVDGKLFRESAITCWMVGILADSEEEIERDDAHIPNGSLFGVGGGKA